MAEELDLGADERLTEDWELIERLLPDQWEEKGARVGSL